MWGFGGRYYWGREKENGGKGEGIVVVFAWMSSEEKHVNRYVQLYSSLNWNSLVCHSQFLNMFFPEKAETLAFDILKELVEELKVKPCPVVFVSFSGGPKACMYKALQVIFSGSIETTRVCIDVGNTYLSLSLCRTKPVLIILYVTGLAVDMLMHFSLLQIIDGTCETQLNMDDRQLVKDCLSGYIYDSSPVDFTSDLGARFVVHPTVLNMSHPPRVISWIANGIASSLDALFLNRFESHRAEYWQTLYSSVTMGAPYLILCSEDDDLAPYQIIYNFAQRLRELGGDVKLVNWNGSPHVGHYRHYPIDYKAAVTELLGKSAAVYSQRIQRLEGERMGLEGTNDEIHPIDGMRKAAASPTHSFRGTPLVPSDHFFMPSSLEYYDGRDVGSVQDQHKEELIHLHTPPTISAHGVLGQILFDVCVPKNVEGWDIRSSDSLNGRSYMSTRRHSPFNPIKCIRRSRL
ncbi:hypothetical protein Dsin_003313 [Dipteronia sinensis]|uniref:DUF829 domain-containing protein n=1 Tax=Dipteronia sinensis TaxID=43782 RepID=A0AAE0B8W0_9ROSI|nr:hypothetical protein Dsin_003313 [Dipteronia sinensis]